MIINQLKIILFYVFLGICSVAVSHPLHLTVCNLEIYEDSAQVSIKIFMDDFTDVLLHHNPNSNIDLIKIDSVTQVIIEEYINQNYIIYSKQNKCTLNWMHHQNNDEAIWLNFSIPCGLNIQELEIKNSILTDWFGDQKNLLMIAYQEKEYGLAFDSKTIKRKIKP